MKHLLRRTLVLQPIIDRQLLIPNVEVCDATGD